MWIAEVRRFHKLNTGDLETQNSPPLRKMCRSKQYYTYPQGDLSVDANSSEMWSGEGKHGDLFAEISASCNSLTLSVQHDKCLTALTHLMHLSFSTASQFTAVHHLKADHTDGLRLCLLHLLNFKGVSDCDAGRFFLPSIIYACLLKVTRSLPSSWQENIMALSYSNAAVRNVHPTKQWLPEPQAMQHCKGGVWWHR